MTPQRAHVLLRSGRRLDLLDPDPDSWTDEDLAIGLSRTHRWGGHSKWDLPLSVAQHSLLVLAIREEVIRGVPSHDGFLHALLHDAGEGLLGFDCITPLKPHLGPAFAAVTDRLKAAIARRYRLPGCTPEEHALCKHADRLAAASEAFHVAGWSRAEMTDGLGIETAPLLDDPLRSYIVGLPEGLRPWEPWPADLAARLFLQRLEALGEEVEREAKLRDLAGAFSRLPAHLRARCGHAVTGNPLFDTLVHAEAGGHSGSVEGVVVAGARDPDGAWDLDGAFTVFTTDHRPEGELLVVHGYSCLVDVL